METQQTNMQTDVSSDKMSKKSIIGMVILTVIALAGVAFGVFGMVGKQEAEKNLAIKIKEASGKVTEIVTDKIVSTDEDGTVTEITNDVVGYAKNPVIPYNSSFDSSYMMNEGTDYRFSIGFGNGEIKSCRVLKKMSDYGWAESSNCDVNGLSGKVYKIVEVGKGNDNSGDYIAFIMEDGSVEVASLYGSLKSGSVDILEKINIGGAVKDAFIVNISDGEFGGYGSTIFVLSDGSVVEYDESMIVRK